jgi:glycine hydroxymethyltransferase
VRSPTRSSSRDRSREALFGAEHANVQPHAGAQTNMAVYRGTRSRRHHSSPELSNGAISHMAPQFRAPTASSITECRARRTRRLRRCAEAGERAPTEAHRVRGSAYPRTVEARRFREIADDVGARPATCAFRWLVAAGFTPTRLSTATSSHRRRTRRSPGRGRGSSSQGRARPGPRQGCFPGMQGGPLNHVIAAKATCFRIAASEQFRHYQESVARTPCATTRPRRGLTS